MKILIIFLSGLGNAVLFEPTLRAIKNFFPNCWIDMLIKQKVVAELYEDSGLVDNFIFGRKLPLKKYDVVISTSLKLGWKEKLFLFLVQAKRKITYDQVGYSEDIHEVDCRLRLAAALGAKPVDRMPRIYIPKGTKNFIKKTKDILTIGIHPGSSEKLKYKRWLPERFAQAADILAEKYNAEIVIFGGPEEIDLSQKIAKMTKTKPLILTGKTSIKETALAISQCDLFITNDSGLMHIASAMNVPLVAIFGPTSPVKNAPLVKNHIVLYKEGSLDKISVDDVIKAADKILSRPK